MTERAVIDASRLKRTLPSRPHPLWWGIAGLIVIEVTVFASFLASFFYLQMWAADWPPADVGNPPLVVPTLIVVLLVGSSAAMIFSGRGAQRGDDRATWLGVAIAVALAIVVLGLRWWHLASIGFRWDSHAYGSIVWTMTGLHFTHVLASALGTGVIGYVAWRGYFTPERRLGIVADAMYWQFVVLVWLPVYLVIYWLPRLR